MHIRDIRDMLGEHVISTTIVGNRTVLVQIQLVWPTWRIAKLAIHLTLRLYCDRIGSEVGQVRLQIRS